MSIDDVAPVPVSGEHASAVATRLQHEFTEEDEQLFKRLVAIMRLVQKLYTAHAVITFVSVTDAVRKSGAMEIPGYFDVVNELHFAFFIGKASASLARIFRTVGDDVTHLMDAILFQEKFFKKLCPPLTIKSLIIVAKLVVGNLQEIKATRPCKLITGIPGTIAKTPRLLGTTLKSLPGFVKEKLGKKRTGPPKPRLEAVKAHNINPSEGKMGFFWKL